NIVFHAAAHKHVPLMEHSGCEAIKNNVRGTYNTADMAEKYGVEKFILISTDKAVNPTNIMGASKRLCEMVIQCRTDSKTSFAAVRFGNVLGSNGSVIPLFRNQIANGGPVTITDKRITRFFMTIPEASQLVMQAGAMTNNGELFVLDMGKSVKIYDLAVNMIKLSGFEPNVDIQIREIGLRHGEKLYEELLMKTETLTKTDNNKIFIEKDTPYSREQVEEKLAILDKAVVDFNDDINSTVVKEAIRQVVPTFHDPEELNKDVK
ncbi:MAG: polysaccharide biosynthesis protein, partial [Clostridia bacterium]|nr:polysaccharide biosynthesis protein [Clostridia bacterium]